jgi:hypothetical protein
MSMVSKALDRTQSHLDTCECFDCCFLIGYGARSAVTPMLKVVMAAIDGHALYQKEEK